MSIGRFDESSGEGGAAIGGLGNVGGIGIDSSGDNTDLGKIYDEINDGLKYSGSKTKTLNIDDVQLDMNGNKYRVQINSDNVLEPGNEFGGESNKIMSENT